MTIVPFPEWLPDQPDFASAGAPVIKNCVPATKASYGPMPTPQPYSFNTLDARCQGAYVIRDASGAPYVYAGDATKLYRMPPAFDSFFDVSRVTGVYTTPSPAAGGFWSMTAFGNRIIASNYTDAIQSMLLSGTNFDVLSPDAPRAKFITVVKDFVFAGNVFSSADGAVPFRVHWSGLGQPDQWPLPGSVTALQLQSDYQDLQQQDLGAITGMQAGFIGASDVAIFCENGLWGGNYVGPPVLFNFRVIAGAPGTMSPLSIVPGRMRTAAGSAAQVAMYLSESGFQAFDGTAAIPFGAGKFDREFFRELNGKWIGYVQGVSDPTSNLIYWAFASETSADGLFDRLLVYNWDLARAVICELEAIGLVDHRSEWLTRGLFGQGYTLDTIDSFGDLDTVQPPFDDPFWAGTTAGRLTTFAPDHRLHTWVGPAMAPTLDLPETQPFPGRRAWVTNARPLIDAPEPGDDTVTVQVGARERLSDAVTWSAQIPVNILGDCPQRTTGRYVRMRFAMTRGVNFQALQGLDVDMVPEGKLR
jgi:hypothetical protein